MITDYASLKEAVAARVERADQGTAIEEAIDGATMRLSRDMRLYDQEARATDTADDEYTVLPNDYNGMKELRVNGKRAEFMTLELFIRMLDQSPTLMNKHYYTIVDNSLRLYPAPNVSETAALEMIYFQRITELGAPTDSNWVLRNHPDIYLAAAMAEFQMHMKDYAAAETWERRLNAFVTQAVVASRRRRFPAATLVITRG